MLDQVRIVYLEKWHELLASVDLTAVVVVVVGVPSLSVQPCGEFYDGFRMAADVHNYYNRQDNILNILEFGDKLATTNPTLEHINAHEQPIYSIHVYLLLVQTFMHISLQKWWTLYLSIEITKNYLVL
jgi:hypothetical protein